MPRTKDVSQSALIAAVEQHAELWDLEHPQYADRVYKLRAWDEVYKALTSNWDRLSPQDKKLRVQPVIWLRRRKRRKERIVMRDPHILQQHLRRW